MAFKVSPGNICESQGFETAIATFSAFSTKASSLQGPRPMTLASFHSQEAACMSTYVCLCLPLGNNGFLPSPTLQLSHQRFHIGSCSPKSGEKGNLGDAVSGFPFPMQSKSEEEH